MRRIIIISLLALILIGMLFHIPIVIQGAHTGLRLWYESVLPSILPFMIITSLLLRQVQGTGVCFLGFFCGLPVGANLVNQQSLTGQIPSGTANRLLCICNLTSPMFILGFILNQTLDNQVSIFKFLCTIYLPIALYGFWTLFWHKHHPANSHLSPSPASYKAAGHPSQTKTASPVSILSLDETLKHSLTVILMVGLYIMLFCIIIQFLLYYLPSDSIPLKLLTASLEITNGVHLLANLPISFQQKTALIAGLTSFGGICSVLQTQSVLTNNELSIFHYIIVKLCMGGLSYLLALLWL